MVKLKTLLIENILDHAKRELKLAGYNVDNLDNLSSIDSMDNYANMIAKSVLDLLSTFSNQGHSGLSAPYTIQLFNQLANQENLTPITSNADEWNDVSQYGANDSPPLWQNSRNYAYFSKDGGKTWYNINDTEKSGVNEIKIAFKSLINNIK